MEEKYLVIEEQRDGLGDAFTEVKDTLDEANLAAKYKWSHLTQFEQKKNHVFVARVTREDLYEDAFDEDADGNPVVDWTCFKQYDTVGFDSGDADEK